MTKKDFIIELSKFYKIFLTDTARSIEQLKFMQEKYSEDYKNWVQLQKDPSALLELSKNLDNESRKTLIDLFVRASTISNKMVLIFEMSPNEKQKFVEEIKAFSDSLDKEIKEKDKK
nr:hypothetical protein [Nanoarchaeum sp.]